MKKLQLLLLIPVLFAFSCEKEEEKEEPPDKVIVERITVTDFPETKPNGNEWDENANPTEAPPDLTFNIFYSGKDMYSLETVHHNCEGATVVYDSDQSYDKIVFDNVKRTYNFKLWDYDIDKELISNIEFVPWKAGEDKPSTKTYSYNKTTLEFKYSYE